MPHDHGDHSGHAHFGHSHAHTSEKIWKLILALVLAAISEAMDAFLPHTSPIKIGMLSAALVAIVLAGASTYVQGWRALRHLRLNIDALMTVAVSGAFVIGQWPEAAMVMALYALAERIEGGAVDKARHAIGKLLALTPQTTEQQQDDGSWREVLVRDVPLQAVVRVKPGASIALDGVIVNGCSAVNQAAVTGESLPIDKQPGDVVFAGTLNEGTMLEIRVTALASNTLLARIIRTVEQAQHARAPTQRFVDRFAAYYTPAIFGLALAVAFLTPWLLGWGVWQAIYKSLVLLVIACPCALVIATPVTVVSGLTAAARRGVLIKGGVHLENAADIKAVAFDKTGTLTEGKPQLIHHQICHEAPCIEKDDAAATPTTAQPLNEATVLAWAAALAALSNHPVAKAIAQGLSAAGDSAGARPQVEAFTALPGQGVQGTVEGQMLMLGSSRLIHDKHEAGWPDPALKALLAQHEAQGYTVTLLASSTRVLAIFAVADAIKLTSRQAITSLRHLGVCAVMLSGDNLTTVHTIAKQAGIDDARGDLMPDDKLAVIESLQQRLGMTAMVGDGINDAPALARADLGVAMGSIGADVAMETADIVIMNDDLRSVPDTLRLSRRLRTILRQNIALALGIKGIFLALAIFGNATMWMAVFADMGASLLVVFNGLRMAKNSPEA